MYRRMWEITNEWVIGSGVGQRQNDLVEKDEDKAMSAKRMHRHLETVPPRSCGHEVNQYDPIIQGCYGTH